MSLKCNLCEYTTIRSDNLTRHIHLKHSQTVEVFYCDYCYSGFTTASSKARHMRKYCDYVKNLNRPAQKVCQPAQNTTRMAQNTTQPAQNTTRNSQNVTRNSQNVVTDLDDQNIQENDKQCIYCDRIFRKTFNKNRHEEKCKKVKSSLECPNCHRIFANSGSKARHLKDRCKEANHQLIPVENQSLTNVPITNNINSQTNNINTQTNNVNSQNNNINSHNINIITFKNDRMDRISFKRDHITQDKINQLIHDAMHNNALDFHKEFTTRYCSAVLEKPENRCIDKSNLSSHYSKVHIGDNKWRNAIDSIVYPKLTSDISEDLYEDILYNRFNLAISKYLRNSLDTFVNYMADYGYCSDESKEKEIMTSYKELVDRVKIMISNFSLEKEEELKNSK
jgi:hypothetical protein